MENFTKGEELYTMLYINMLGGNNKLLEECKLDLNDFILFGKKVDEIKYYEEDLFKYTMEFKDIIKILDIKGSIKMVIAIIKKEAKLMKSIFEVLNGDDFKKIMELQRRQNADGVRKVYNEKLESLRKTNNVNLESLKILLNKNLYN